MAPSAATPSESLTSTQQLAWFPRKRDMKGYLHFDRALTRDQLATYVSSPENVARHGFYPLIYFEQQLGKFRLDGTRRVKIRPLRCCSRKDAGIYAYYRWRWKEDYERYLCERGIAHVPIAYRSLADDCTGKRKTNIEFARDAFDAIRKMGDCDVTIIDISAFFESLDHLRLHERLQSVLGRALSGDEENVFRSLTNYAVVDRDELYKRAGMFKKGVGTARKFKRERKLDRYRRKGLKQLLSKSEFNELVLGKGGKLPSIVQKHTKNMGIPQGTPVSDLLANVYMIEFDRLLSRWVRKRGGFVSRYSDDVIIVVPKSFNTSPLQGRDYVQSLLERSNETIKFKSRKVAVGRFIRRNNTQFFTHLIGPASQNGIEYLGFQFDGQTVRLKNATMSNAWRKVIKRMHGWAKRYARRYRDKGATWVLNNADVSYQVQRIIQVAPVEVDDVRKWTFNRYRKRCEIVFSDYNHRFEKQTRRYRKVAHSIGVSALNTAVKKHVP